MALGGPCLRAGAELLVPFLNNDMGEGGARGDSHRVEKEVEKFVFEV